MLQGAADACSGPCTKSQNTNDQDQLASAAPSSVTSIKLFYLCKRLSAWPRYSAKGNFPFLTLSAMASVKAPTPQVHLRQTRALRTTHTGFPSEQHQYLEPYHKGEECTTAPEFWSGENCQDDSHPVFYSL
jgi:hypothetical protein